MCLIKSSKVVVVNVHLEPKVRTNYFFHRQMVIFAVVYKVGIFFEASNGLRHIWETDCFSHFEQGIGAILE